MPSAAASKAEKKIFDSPEELVLVRRAKKKDEAAFTVLYQHHYNRVRVTINKIVHDEDMAAELANETLTKVWQKLSGFDEQSKFSTWITRIAINEGLMHLRREKSNQRQAESASLEAMMISRSPRHEEGELQNQRLLSVRDLSLEGIADRQLIERAISRVPLRYREILRLRFWDGLQLEDIRRTINGPLKKGDRIKLSAIKTRLLRGRRMMMAHVAEMSAPVVYLG